MSDTTSYFLRFRPNSAIDGKGFFVSALVGAAPQGQPDDATPWTLQVDTGSCGIAIGIEKLSTYYQQQVRDQGAAALLVTYLPSKNEIWGWWAKPPVILFGPDAPPEQYDASKFPAATVSVMVADYVKVNGITQKVFDGGMMGIGFHTDVATVLARNPLLSASAGGQSLSAGYVISPDGIDIGLTDSNIAGFSFTNLVLQTGSNPPVYNGPAADLTASFNGAKIGPIACDLLMDTGVQDPMLFTETQEIPQSFYQTEDGKSTFATGVEFSIDVTGTTCSYSFTLGQPSVFTPPGFLLMDRQQPNSSLNTSIYLLGGYNYCLDYAGKRMGFSRRAP